MRICIVTPIFPPQIGGPATYVSELAEQLHKNKHDVRVITLGKELPKEIPYSVYLVRRQNILLKEISLFKKIMEHAKGCDVIYAQGIAAIGMPSVLAGRILKKKVVVKYVGDSAWEKALREGKTQKSLEEFLDKPDAMKWMVKIQKKVLHSADLIVTPSLYLKYIIEKYYNVDEKKIMVVYNSVDLRQEKVARIKTSGMVILTIGRLVPWKNMDMVIKAFEIAGRYEKSAKLAIIGDGPLLKSLQDLVGSLKLSDRVMFLGRKPHGEVLGYMRASKMFVLFSSYEGMSHVLLEAMACKTPIVASDIRPNKELIKDKYGTSVKSGDVDQLAKTMVSLLRNRKKATRMALLGYEKIKKEHDKNEKYEEIVKVLEKVVGSE